MLNRTPFFIDLKAETERELAMVGHIIESSFVWKPPSDFLSGLMECDSRFSNRSQRFFPLISSLKNFVRLTVGKEVLNIFDAHN